MSRVIVVMFCFVFLMGQDSACQLSQMIQRRWSVDQGLPQTSVQAIFQTELGYLLLGTQEGAVRFDGESFHALRRGTGWESDNSYIYEMAQDAFGVLWVATRNGLIEWRGEESKTWLESDGLPSNRIFDLKLASSGAVWLATGAGVARLHGGEIRTWNEESGLKHNGIRALFVDSEGRVWIGSSRGLDRIDQGALVDSAAVNFFDGQVVSAISQGPDGSIWAASANRIYNLQGDEWTEHQLNLPKQAFPLDICFLNGEVWTASTLGLARLMADGTCEKAFENSVIRSLLADREGNLWVGTASLGLVQLRCGAVQPWGQTEGVAHNNIWGVSVDPSGSIWAAHDAGISKKNGRAFENVGVASDISVPFRNVFHIGEKVFAASRRQGLFIGKFNEKNLTRYSDPQQLLNNVRDVVQGRDESIWAATFGNGLIQLEPTFEVHRFENLAHNFIYDLEFDGQDGFWMGTDGGGLVHWKPEGIQVYDKEYGIKSNLITSVLMDSEKNIWFACDRGGLNLLDVNRELHAWNEVDGLPHHSVFFLVLDSQDWFWMSSNMGIFGVSRKSLLNQKIDPGWSLNFQQLANGSGMRSRECNFAGGSAGAVDPSGTVWFATVNGLASFLPHEPLTPFPNPITVIEQVTVNGENLSLDHTMMDQEVNRLEISFTSLSLTDARENKYRYRLRGLEEDWQEGGKKAVYTTLPAGEYLFEVFGSNHRGTWSEKAASFPIRVKASWTKNLGFKLGLLLVGVGIIIFFFQWRVRALKKRQQHLELLVSQRTNALEEANKILVSSQSQLLRAAHQSGKSEISIGILHNMGNALNSLNVATQVVIEKLSHIVPQTLQKIADRIKEEGVESFEGNQADKVLDALPSMVNHLAMRAEGVGREVEEIRASVEHLDQIVKAQQGQISDTRLMEWVEFKPTIHTALKILKPIIAKHNIEFSIEAETINPQQLPASTLLQILINLLKNACEAIMEREPELPKINVRCFKKDQNVVIEVQDNGVGISPEVARKMFTMGFTTKPYGHGFGLHFCGLAAKELGGTLEARTTDPGATFVLTLPFRESDEAVKE